MPSLTDLEADLVQFRELLTKTIADANAIRGCMQYIELQIAKSSDEPHIVVPGKSLERKQR